MILHHVLFPRSDDFMISARSPGAHRQLTSSSPALTAAASLKPRELNSMPQHWLPRPYIVQSSQSGMQLQGHVDQHHQGFSFLQGRHGANRSAHAVSGGLHSGSKPGDSQRGLLGAPRGR